MKKIGKYITVAVLSVCLFCLSAIPSFAYTEGYFRYEITDGVLTITEYFGREEEATVQNMIAGTPVSVIGENVFNEEEDVIIDITLAAEDKPTTAEDGAIAEAGDNAPAPENSPEAPAEKAPNNNTLLCVIIYAVAVIAVAAVGIIVFVKRKKK